jgi:hypothetical protein
LGRSRQSTHVKTSYFRVAHPDIKVLRFGPAATMYFYMYWKAV